LRRILAVRKHIIQIMANRRTLDQILANGSIRRILADRARGRQTEALLAHRNQVLEDKSSLQADTGRQEHFRADNVC
jgi:hypothetical protein